MNSRITHTFILLLAINLSFLLDAPDLFADLKIKVEREGIYRLSYNDLLAAGLDPSGIDPRTIRISNKGKEVRIHVEGEGDGQFDSSDYIEFYGKGIDRGTPQFEYTSENVYRLSSGGSNGLRMAARDGTPGGAATPSSYIKKIHMETDSYYWLSIPNGAGKDHWFWGNRLYGPSAKTYSFTASNIDGSAHYGAMRVALYGRSNDSVSPDHHTRIYLNNQLIDDRYWDGQVQYIHEISFMLSYLAEGTNVLKVETVGDTGAASDIIHMDWFEVDFPASFTVQNNELLFDIEGADAFEFSLAGFTQAGSAIFDISDHDNPVRFINYSTTQVGSLFTVRFEDTPSETSRYIALTPSQRLKPIEIINDIPSSLKDSFNSADYIIISYDDFIDNVAPLAQHHRDKGLRVMTVKISDIYDEFSHGITDPQAIKDFLSYSYHNWSPPAPLFVLLVGDATIDPKDKFAKGNKDYIPTHFFETALLGHTPDDNWFVSVNGPDNLPDMFIGRLPVQTEGEVTDMVNKIIGYDDSEKADWNSDVMLIADNNEPAFELLTEELAAEYLPEDYNPVKIYMKDFTTGTEANNAVITGLNNGAIATVYAGHGSVDNWAGEYMLETGDIPSLTNSDRLTFVTALNCLNGFFPLALSALEPWNDGISLAEGLILSPDKGAIAVFASTSLGYTSDHSLLAKETFSGLFGGIDKPLGQVTTEAKLGAFAGGASGEVVRTFTLFGDPALSLKTLEEETEDPTGNGSETSYGGGSRDKDLLNEGCFIATAAYGSYFEPHVMVLRNFRDLYLLSNGPGTKLVEFYYRHSPPLAKVIAGDERLRTLSRWALFPLVALVSFMVHTSLGAKAVMTIALSIMLYLSVRKRTDSLSGIST